MDLKPLIGITTYFVTDQELTDRRVRGTIGQDMVMSNLDCREFFTSSYNNTILSQSKC